MKFSMSSLDPSLQVLYTAPAHAKSSDHILQFYEDESYLLNSVGLFLTSGLRGGEGVLVIGTRDHNQSLRARLGLLQSAVAEMIERGQIVFLNAEETIPLFMRDGVLDPLEFRRVIGDALTRLAQNYGRIRAFGEMVNVLWERGEEEATLELERLWNRLLSERSASLLCAYRLGGFPKEGQRLAFHEICCAHTHVIPTESFTGIQDHRHRLRVVAELQQKALALEAETASRIALENRLRSLQDELLRARNGQPSV